jgi:hypothetical protein
LSPGPPKTPFIQLSSPSHELTGMQGWKQVVPTEAGDADGGSHEK